MVLFLKLKTSEIFFASNVCTLYVVPDYTNSMLAHLDQLEIQVWVNLGSWICP